MYQSFGAMRGKAGNSGITILIVEEIKKMIMSESIVTHTWTLGMYVMSLQN